MRNLRSGMNKKEHCNNYSNSPGNNRVQTKYLMHKASQISKKRIAKSLLLHSACDLLPIFACCEFQKYKYKKVSYILTQLIVKES